MNARVLILGLGNILLQDEGLGVRTVEMLTTGYRLPPEVQTLDGGVMGLDLLPYFDGVTDLLILDAVQAGQSAGTLLRLEGDAIPAALSAKMSMHQVSLQELLALASFQGILPTHVVLLGLEPASLDWGLGLTPVVASRLDLLVAAAVSELQSWGLSLTPTTPAEA
jgi:hydrogenase maturation protease